MGQPEMRSVMPDWWKWIALAATVYMSVVVNGYAYCFGLLKIQLHIEYPEISSMTAAIVGGLVPSIYLALAPFGIALCEFAGARFVTFVGSVLSAICFVLVWLNGILFQAGFIVDLLLLGVGQGVSFALLYGPSFTVLPSYFRMNQLSLATGITAAGASCGVILYGFISNPLFEIYGWRGAMLFYAMLSLQGVLAGLAFAKLVPVKAPTTGDVEMVEAKESEEVILPKQTEQRPKRTFFTVLKTYFDSKLICQGPFVLLLFSAAFSIVGYFVPTILIPAQTKRPEFAVHPLIQKNIMVIFGICNLISRVVIGRLGDYSLRFAAFTSFSFFVGGLVVAAAACLIFPHAMPLGNVAFVTFIVIYAIAVAPVITVRSLLTINMFGKPNANASFGWFLCAQGSMQMFGYVLPSWLDTIGAVFAYLFAACMFIGSAICCASTSKLFFAERRKMIAAIKAGEN